MFFTFFFISRVFLYFSLSKTASCSWYTHCHSSKLEFFSNLGLENSPHYYGAYHLISLLNLPNSATSILYHSSLVRSFHPCNHGVHGVIRLWYFLAYKHDCSIIHSLPNFSLIMAKFLCRTGSIWPVDCGFGPPAKYDSALGL